MKRNLKHISASQIKAFRLCPRKWFFRSVLKVRHPPTAAMRYGTKVHKELESALSAETVDLGPESKFVLADLARAGLDPESIGRAQGFTCELSIKSLGLELAGLTVLGYIDLIWYDPDTRTVHIPDYKVRSSFDYAPDPDALRVNPQTIIYGRAATLLYPDAEYVTAQHINILKVTHGGPAVKPVAATLEPGEIEQMWFNSLEQTAWKMKGAAHSGIRHVMQHKTSCFVYGRCEYMDECYNIPYSPTPGTNPTPADDPWEGEPMLNLDDLLKKKQSTAAPVEPAPAPAPTPPVEAEVLPPEPAPAPAPTPKPAVQTIEITAQTDVKEVVSELVPNPAPNILPDDAEPDRAPVDVHDMSVAEFDWTDVDGIGDKGAQKVLEYLTEEGIAQMSELANIDLRDLPGIGKKTAASIREAIQSSKTWTPDPAIAGITSGRTPADTPNTPSTPKPAKTLADVDKAPDGLTPAQIVARAKVAVKTGKVPDLTGAGKEGKRHFEQWRSDVGDDYARDTLDSGGGEAAVEENTDAQLVLYINCYPVKGANGVVDLDRLLAPLKDAVAAELGVPYWDAKPFAEGGKLLAAKVIENLEMFAGKTVYCDDRRPEIPRVLQVLIGRADLVIKGS